MLEHSGAAGTPATDLEDASERARLLSLGRTVRGGSTRLPAARGGVATPHAAARRVAIASSSAYLNPRPNLAPFYNAISRSKLRRPGPAPHARGPQRNIRILLKVGQ